MGKTILIETNHKTLKKGMVNLLFKELVTIPLVFLTVIFGWEDMYEFPPSEI